MSSDMRDLIKLHLIEYLAQAGISLDKGNKGLCPLHPDKKTKSLAMVPGSGNTKWICFGCNRSGDIFDLVHEIEGLPVSGPAFYEITVPLLANRFGISYHPAQPRRGEKDVPVSQIHNLYDFIRRQLVNDAAVEKFAQDRGLDADVLKRFGVGRIKSFAGLRQKIKKQFDDRVIAAANLYDHRELFEDRILFTLRDEFGRPCGFAGRRLAGEQDKKYINSRNSPVFNKSEFLYNFHQAKRCKRIYLVEGYTDVIRMHQEGIANVAALCGTAITEINLERLKQFERVIFTLDGDEAGIKQSDKTIGKLPNAAAIVIPDGHDPDSFIRNYGIESFKAIPELEGLSWRIRTGHFHQEHDVSRALRSIMAKPKNERHSLLKLLAQSSRRDYVLLKDSLDEMLTERTWQRLRDILNMKETVTLNLIMEVNA